ncbi:hypothetical protein OXX80_012600 [Metschnikowia pulcherrima]
MKIAHKVDAATKDSFWFKNPRRWNVDNEIFKGFDLSWFDRFLNDGNDLLCNNAVYLNGYDDGNGNVPQDFDDEEPNEVRLTADKIINGGDNFPGLIRMIVKYVSRKLVPEACVSDNRHCKIGDAVQQLTSIQQYLKLVSGRASGKIPTTAHFLRDYVLKHPDYKRDSKVSESINFDLAELAASITYLNAEQDDLLSQFFGKEVFHFIKSQRDLAT